MARFLCRPVPGIAQQLLAGSSSGLLQEVAALAATANALRNPIQQCWMHSPACSAVASSAHSYHGSRDDEDGVKPNNDDSSTDDTQTSDTDAAVTRQMEAIQQEIQKALREDQQFRDVSQLPEHIARQFMKDPLGMILSSQGVPMGISLKVNPQKLMKHRQQQLQRDGEADKRDWQELLGQGARSRKDSSSADEHYTAVPRTDAQLMKLKCAEVASKLVKEARRTKRNNQLQKQQQASQSMHDSSDAVDNQVTDGKEQSSGSTIGQQAKEQLSRLMATVDHDSWGTTQQSPAEIAQHIADSNMSAGGGGGDDGDEGGENDDEPLELSDMEQRFADQSAVTAELKEMDEIYEVLAKVPWLNDDDVDERELRGVVAVGLLGTLEEVGWQLREPLLSLWAGERDLDKLTANVGPREAAALTAILYHTEQLEQEYSKPPREGVEAALAAAGAPASVQDVPPRVTDGEESAK